MKTYDNKRKLMIMETDNAKTKEFIRRGLVKNGGYCPCAVFKTEDTICPCKEFRQETTETTCHCGLYKKVHM